MGDAYKIKLGDNRRLALPAKLCRKLDLQPGEVLLLTETAEGLTVTSLRRHAEQARQELRHLLGEGSPLTDDLKQLRRAEAAREADLG